MFGQGASGNNDTLALGEQDVFVGVGDLSHGVQGPRDIGDLHDVTHHLAATLVHRFHDHRGFAMALDRVAACSGEVVGAWGRLHNLD